MKNVTSNIILICVVILLFNTISLSKEDKTNISTLTEVDSLIVDDDGDEDYTSIQDAIDNACSGSIIFVHSGLYEENIILEKQIILIGIKEDKQDIPTIRPLDKKNDTIDVYTDNCVIFGFKIYGSNNYNKAGINLNSNNNIIENNTIINSSFFGINLVRVKNNKILENVFINNSRGIKLEYADKNTITHNKIQQCWTGVWLHRSSSNIINYNTFTRNYYSIAAMYKSNRLQVLNNTFINNTYAIDLWKSNSNNIEKNLIENCSIDGFRIWGCKFNKIKYNTFVNNSLHGILIFFSLFQDVIGNNFIGNNVGLYLRSKSKFHKMRNNNFIKNNVSATFYASTFNYWIRNYWDNHTEGKYYKIKGKISHPNKSKREIDWINIDWDPLEVPYIK